jgi:hypothetical protein
MRRVLLLVLSVLAVTPSAAQSPGETSVTLRQLAENRYEITAAPPVDFNEAQVQAALMPLAQQTCAGRTARWGRHRFKKRQALTGEPEDTDTQTFIQEFECADALSVAVEDTGTPAPLTPPSEDDKRKVTEQTLAFLAARDRNDFASALEFISEPTREMLSSPNGNANRRDFNAAAGEPESRQVVRLTWYDNPAGAPRRGRYVAADYRGDYSHPGFYCGYAMWYLDPDAQFRIVRMEEGVMTPETVQSLTSEQKAGMRQQLGCRD